MVNKHSDRDQAVHYRLPKDLVAAYTAAAKARGEDIKAFVIRALRNELQRQEKADQRAAEYLSEMRAEGSEYNAIILIGESSDD